MHRGSKQMPEFGLSADCGFGQEKPAEMPRVLEYYQMAAAL